MRRSRSENTGISYVSTGAPDAPLVLCLHGFPDIPRMWDPLADVLTTAGFRVVRPWLPGYAPSSRQGPFDPPALSRRVLELVDELAPRDPIRIVGHDWGAVIACCAMSLSPERFRAAAVLAVPHPLVMGDNFGRYPRQLARSAYMALFQVPIASDRLVRVGNFRFIERLWKTWSPGFDPGADYFDELKQCLSASWPAPLLYYRAFRSPKVMRQARDLLSGAPIPVPTIYLHGERDGCVGIEMIEGQEKYFSALFETVRLAEAGHFLHLERPKEVNATTLRWFEEH